MAVPERVQRQGHARSERQNDGKMRCAARSYDRNRRMTTSLAIALVAMVQQPSIG
jgi:hypothetical protein